MLQHGAVSAEDERHGDATAETEAAAESATLHDTAARATPERVSAEQAGRYRMREELGRGGIGRVLIAFDAHVGREVAFKELLAADGAGSQSATVAGGRFVREARITGQLEHPAIVPVYEIGQRADGRYYYAMRIVRGRTLSSAIGCAASVEERLALLPHFVDLCNAIAYAHSRGVIHRDIKPQNIMIGEFGETVVLDWGLAKPVAAPEHEDQRFTRAMRVLEAAAAGETVDGHALGTPSYMPPEQALGEIRRIDERSDVYAMGAVLYELLAGSPPFVGYSGAEIVDKVRRYGRGELGLLSPRELVAEAPPELCAVTARALAPRIEDRYLRAKDLLAEVQAYLAGRRVAAYEYSSWELLRRFAAKNRSLLSLGAALAACIVAALVVVSLSYRQELAARRRASYHLAEALHEKASRLEEEGRFLTSRIYAAASLLHNPAHPRSPQHDPAYARDPRAARLRVEAASRIYVARHQLLRPRARLASPKGVWQLAASPDGTTLAAALADGSVELWDLRLRRARARLRDRAGNRFAVAFSPDGKLLASGTLDGRVRLWEAASGRARATIKAHSHWVPGVAFSPDGKLLASAGHDRLVRLSRVADGAAVATLAGHAAGVNAVAFSPDGKLLASSSHDKTIRLWPLPDGPPRVLVGHADSVRGLAFSPDGKLLASASFDHSVRLWRPDGSAAGTLAGHRDVVYGVAFAPDGGRLVSASADGTAIVWDAESRARSLTLDAHQAGLSAVAFIPGASLIATASEDRTSLLWEARPALPIPVLRGHELGIVALAFSASGELLASTSTDLTLRLWQSGRGPGRPRATFVLPAEPHPAAFSPDQRLIAVGFIGGARIFEVASRRELVALPHPGEVYGVGFTPDGKELLTAGRDALRVYPIGDTRPRLELSDPRTPGRFYAVAISPDGEQLAASHADGSLRLFARRSGALQRRWAAHRDRISGLAYSPDGRRLASSGKDARVAIWDPASGRELRTLRAHSEWVNYVSFSPDGRRLYSTSDDRTLAVHDAASGEHLLSIRCPYDALGLAVAPDGTVAVASRREIWLHTLDLSFLGRDPARELSDAERDAGLVLDGFRLRSAAQEQL
jgi:WD40 repeat protein/serine/threonine protein kinase